MGKNRVFSNQTNFWDGSILFDVNNITHAMTKEINATRINDCQIIISWPTVPESIREVFYFCSVQVQQGKYFQPTGEQRLVKINTIIN